MIMYLACRVAGFVTPAELDFGMRNELFCEWLTASRLPLRCDYCLTLN